MMKVIGANCQFQNGNNRYVSFGQYDEGRNQDEYGVPDDQVFFYCFEGENELKKNIGKSLTGDDEDVLLSYQLVVFDGKDFY